MRQTRVFMIVIVCLAVVSLVSVHAQSGGGYDLTWNTMDGGGSVSSGGAYSLGGTIGQPDAGSLSGGNYTLSGGFWQDSGSSELPEHRIYLPLVLRQA